jgi:hypothetical protein
MTKSDLQSEVVQSRVRYIIEKKLKPHQKTKNKNKNKNKKNKYSNTKN